MRADATAWRLVERRAEDFITPTRSQKLAALIPVDVSGKTIRALASPTILFLYLRQRLLAFFAKPVRKQSRLGHGTALKSSTEGPTSADSAGRGGSAGPQRDCFRVFT